MNNSRTTFISIEGHGGSGKSTLANRLSRLLLAEVIHIDDFTGEGSKTDWYKSLIEKIINPVKAGATSLSYPRAKWWPDHKPSPVIDQPVTSLMIVEGVGSSRRELRDFMSFKIFIETPRNICIRRGLARDKGMGGKSEEEIIAQWEQWLEWDDEYFAKDNPKAIADIIVDGTKPYDNVLAMLKDEINTSEVT